jgi:hypothetical protein
MLDPLGRRLLVPSTDHVDPSRPMSQTTGGG